MVASVKDIIAASVEAFNSKDSKQNEKNVRKLAKLCYEYSDQVNNVAKATDVELSAKVALLELRIATIRNDKSTIVKMVGDPAIQRLLSMLEPRERTKKSEDLDEWNDIPISSKNLTGTGSPHVELAKVETDN